MKRIWLVLAALAAACFVGSALAQPQVVQIRQSSPLYAGPAYNYPEVAYLPAGTSVLLNGCLSDVPWCDVSVNSTRGWVDANRIQVYARGSIYSLPEASSWIGVPLITFVLDDYWRNYYQNRSWYVQWPRYRTINWRHQPRPSGWMERRPPTHRQLPARPNYERGNPPYRDGDRNQRDYRYRDGDRNQRDYRSDGRNSPPERHRSQEDRRFQQNPPPPVRQSPPDYHRPAGIQAAPPSTSRPESSAGSKPSSRPARNDRRNDQKAGEDH